MNAHVRNLADQDAAEARRLSCEIDRIVLTPNLDVSPQATLAALAHASAGALFATSNDADHARRRTVGFCNALHLALEQIAAGELAVALPPAADASPGSASDSTTWF